MDDNMKKRMDDLKVKRDNGTLDATEREELSNLENQSGGAQDQQTPDQQTPEETGGESSEPGSEFNTEDQKFGQEPQGETGNKSNQE